MTAVLQLTEVSKSFGGLLAVSELDFEVRRGEIFGVIGPNGSGKTTTMNLITGNDQLDLGQVRLEGCEIQHLAAHRIARVGIARTFQLVRIMATRTLAENVAIGAMFGRTPCAPTDAIKRANSVLARVGLVGRGSESAAKLTYIDQKRVELARALALDPIVLLLDEWLAGLNPTELHEGIALIRSINAEGITIVMIEHVMDAIRALCGHCLVMNAGRKLAAGPPDEVLANSAVISVYLGDDHAA
jgi:branched-chain amino acid transport system ATP-binding protein